MPRAEDVPLALAHGIHLAGLPPQGPGLRLDTDGRLAVEVDDADAPRGDRAPGHRPRRRRRPRRSGRWPSASMPRRRPGARRRPRHRRLRRLGCGDRPRRAPAAAGLGQPRRPGGGRLGFPEGHPNFRGVAAAGDRPGRPDARGPRPGPRRRQLGLPLLPLHPRPAAARGGASWSRSPATPTRRRGRRWATRSSPTSGSPSRRCSRPCPSPSRRRRSRYRPPAGAAGRRPAQPLDRPLDAGRGPPRRRDRRPRVARRARSRSATSSASRGPAATTSAPAAASGSASPPRSASSSPSPTARSSASSARARPSTRSSAFWSAVAYDVPVTFLVLRQRRVRDPQVVRRRSRA